MSSITNARKPQITSTSKSAAVGAIRTRKDFVPFSDKLTKSLEGVTKTIEDNKDTLDTIQELGIELTKMVSALSVSALKYANMVNNILDTILPLIQNLPFIPKTTQKFLADLNTFADKFLASCQSAQKISGSVETGLVEGDINALKTHSADLRNVVASVKTIIPDKK